MGRMKTEYRGTACDIQRAEHGRGVNVSDAERVASVVLGGGLVLGGLRRLDSLAGVALSVAGAGLIYRGLAGHCQLYGALGINRSRGLRTGVPARHGVRLDQSIVVDAPPSSVYEFWRDFQNLPRFVNHLESVRPLTGTRSHWVATGPRGVRVEWDAEIINDIPQRLIAWRSLEGSQVDTAGTVRFSHAPGGRGTEVRVEMKYDPPGGKAGVLLAGWLGETPHEQLAHDLERLKRVVEAGEMPSPAGQSSVGVQSALGRRGDGPETGHRFDQVEETSAESFPASDAPGWTGGAGRPRPK